MARTPDIEMKRELLDQVVAYLADQGLGDMSLRPLAASLGISPNRLVHHFGSKQALLSAALARATQIQVEVRDRWLAREPEMTASDQLRKWWKWMNAAPANRALVRLGLEAATLEATHTGLPGDVRAEQIALWRTNLERALVMQGIDPAASVIEASLLKAMFTGLTIDLIASGERARLTRALDAGLALVEARVEVLRTSSARPPTAGPIPLRALSVPHR